MIGAWTRAQQLTVAERCGDAQDLLGEWPVAVAERSRIGRGDHAADGCDGLRSETELGIHGEHHAAAREHALGANQRCSGVDRGRDTALVDDHTAQMTCVQLQRTSRRTAAPGELGRPADDAHGTPLRDRAGKRRGGLAEAARDDGFAHCGCTTRSVIVAAIPARPRDPGKALQRSYPGCRESSRASSPLGLTSSSAAMLAMPGVWAI